MGAEEVGGGEFGGSGEKRGSVARESRFARRGCRAGPEEYVLPDAREPGAFYSSFRHGAHRVISLADYVADFGREKDEGRIRRHLSVI